MENLCFKQISSLEKVFLDSSDECFKEQDGIIALGDERISYQIMYKGDGEKRDISVSFDADERLDITLRTVGSVPCRFACFEKDADEYYLRKTPGLYPDVLYPVEENKIMMHYQLWHSVFVTCKIPNDMPAGEYPITVTFVDGENEIAKKIFTVKVLPACLPKQDVTFTQWFHADCIADYYNYEVFSEEHWRMIEKFIETAVHTGINMLLTPVFTPPLDTEVGAERTTVQLVDVTYKEGKYTFGFDKLKRWVNLCKKYGIEKFEISHLFSQWGTGKTPKIVAETENGQEKIFGWHVDATDKKYEEFLDCFLPELKAFLNNEEIYENTIFHISDEPEEKDIEIYSKEQALISKHIEKEKIFDALSHFEIYEKGLVKKPFVATSSAYDFFEKGINDIYLYYCCGPVGGGYSNRFIAMPAGRTRIMGIQLFKYDIKGFLHWGYNFYNSQLSKRHINPFEVTDSEEAFSAGDPFSVYPGEDGALESLRTEAFYQGLQDARACELLSKYIGSEIVKNLIDGEDEVTLSSYPRENDGILSIRERINKKLEEVLL